MIHLLLLLALALTPRSEAVFSPQAALSFDCLSCTAAIPPRPATAPTGSEFVRQTAGLEPSERERVILAQLRAGNIPAFVRQLKPVELAATTRSGRAVRATIWVTPDYLSIGSNDDFVRIPVSRSTALTIAREFGFLLPTCKMVDAIFKHSQVRLSPLPMPAGTQMRSNAYYLAHSRAIDQQRGGLPATRLTAGHKKDLVLARRLAARPERVAIYGWHRPNGRPIQPLSILHGAGYADYSHGLRLVSVTVRIDGALRSIYDVLEDPELAGLLSNEGIMPEARQILGP